MERGGDFWLQQYQQLLSVRSHPFKNPVDRGLIHRMVIAGVAHCLPLLSCCQLDGLTELQLEQVRLLRKKQQILSGLQEEVKSYYLASFRMALTTSKMVRLNLHSFTNIFPRLKSNHACHPVYPIWYVTCFISHKQRL